VKSKDVSLSKKNSAWVYILECADGSYYTGSTIDLERRIEEHRSGRGARYTRGRLPVKLAFAERQPSRREAMRKEYQLKRWPRKKKEALIRAQIEDLTE
jgi:putative endonuclease